MSPAVQLPEQGGVSGFAAWLPSSQDRGEGNPSYLAISTLVPTHVEQPEVRCNHVTCFSYIKVNVQVKLEVPACPHQLLFIFQWLKSSKSFS